MDVLLWISNKKMPRKLNCACSSQAQSPGLGRAGTKQNHHVFPGESVSELLQYPPPPTAAGDAVHTGTRVRQELRSAVYLRGGRHALFGRAPRGLGRTDAEEHGGLWPQR